MVLCNLSISESFFFFKMTSCHYTLCADIFRENDLFYYSLYDCETPILYPCFISFSFLLILFSKFKDKISSFYFSQNLDFLFTFNLIPSTSFRWGRGWFTVFSSGIIRHNPPIRKNINIFKNKNGGVVSVLSVQSLFFLLK